MNIPLNVIGFLLGIWQLRNFISFLIKTDFGKNYWMFEQSKFPIPLNASIENEKRYFYSGILLICIGILLLFTSLSFIYGLAIGLVIGGIWNCIVGILAISTIKRGMMKNLYPDDEFRDVKFSTLINKLLHTIEHKPVVLIELENGLRYEGMLNVFVKPLKMITLYNSIEQYLFILFSFKNNIYYFTSSGKELIDKSIINNFRITNQFGKSEWYA